MLYGFDMGGTKIELAVFDHKLQQVWSKRVPTPHQSYDALLDVFIELVEEADEKFNVKGQIGIGIAGIPNRSQGTVFTTNVEKAKNRPLILDLEKALSRPVEVDNDANCFVLSEAWSEEFQAYPNILGIILGTGLGGGLVINGKVYSGFNGIAGEIGHLRLPADCLAILGYDTPFRHCGCGQKGCAEGYLSGSGFEWLYTHFYHETHSAKTIIEQYYKGDVNAIAHVERYLALLTAYIGNLCSLFDPSLLVIGGGLSNFDEIYRVVPAHLGSHLFSIARLPRIERARYGDSGGVRGAAFLNATSLNIRG